MINLLETTKHRGISFWPWALNDETFKKLYIAGTYGITTNSTQLYAKYIVDIQAPKNVKVKAEQPVLLNVQLVQQDGVKLNQRLSNFVVLSGSAKHEIKNGQLSFSEKGTVYVLAGYKYQIDAQNFYQIFSAPIKVIIQ